MPVTDTQSVQSALEKHRARKRSSAEEAAPKLPPEEKVIGWLKYLENGEGRRAHREGTPPYDFSWMWRELGVLEERR
jgi:hypothetical protein